MMRSYSELIKIPSFIERYRYLKIGGKVGEATFGCDRWINQVLYTSGEWGEFRNDIIIRDKGYNMAFEGVDIDGLIIVHHLNPITKNNILRRDKCVFDPENVVCVSKAVHDAIHYGDESLLPMISPVIREEYDTCPWKSKRCFKGVYGI